MSLAFSELQGDGQAHGIDQAWILVVSPPRERPMQRDRVCFFTVRGMLMDPMDDESIIWMSPS